jgi:hypothetical protein
MAEVSHVCPQFSRFRRDPYNRDLGNALDGLHLPLLVGLGCGGDHAH